MLASSPTRHMHIIMDMHAESMPYQEVNRYQCPQRTSMNITLGGNQRWNN